MSENYIVINGKKSDLTNEQMKLLGIKVRNNPFERVSKNDFYYIISDKTRVMYYPDEEDETDRELYNSVNYFNDKEFAVQVALHQLLYRKLLKFAYDNECEDTKGWNGTDGHWTIRYNDDSCCFRAYYQERFKASGVYFSSEEGTTRAIKEVVEPFMKEHPEFVW